MTISPTSRQMDLLRFIRGYQLAKGYSPSFEEMAKAVSFSSKSRVSSQLDELEERGLIRRLFGRHRAIELLCQPSIPQAPDGAPLHVVSGVCR